MPKKGELEEDNESFVKRKKFLPQHLIVLSREKGESREDEQGKEKDMLTNHSRVLYSIQTTAGVQDFLECMLSPMETLGEDNRDRSIIEYGTIKAIPTLRSLIQTLR